MWGIVFDGCVVYGGVFPCIYKFNAIIWCRGFNGEDVDGFVSGLL